MVSNDSCSADPPQADSPIRRDWVVGPNGQKLTLSDLPAKALARWTIARKANVIAAVDGGLLTRDEACIRYNLSAEEYGMWDGGLKRWGLNALRITKAGRYRSLYVREQGAIR